MCTSLILLHQTPHAHVCRSCQALFYSGKLKKGVVSSLQNCIIYCCKCKTEVVRSNKTVNMDEQDPGLLTEWVDSVKENLSVMKKHLQQFHANEHALMTSLSHALQSSWNALSKLTYNYKAMNDSSDLELGDEWAQVALDLSWEQLNTGHWKDVGRVWREAYTTAALMKALGLVMKGQTQEALEVTDKGILLGAPILDGVLHSLASVLVKTVNLANHTTIVTADHDLTSVSLYPDADPPVEKKPKVVFRSYMPIQPLSIIAAKTVDNNGGDSFPDKCKASDVPLIDPSRRISVRHCPSLDEFMEQYMKSRVPVVISGAMDHWPAYAVKKWRYNNYYMRI